jgi:hypothetical protein
MKLTIELVPNDMWYKNLRSPQSVHNWNELRSACYAASNHKCEICGDDGIAQGYRHSVECHEQWDYDFENGIQKLTGLICLCPNCHKVKHAGRSLINGELPLVVLQLMWVNDISQDDAHDYIESAFYTLENLNSTEWKQDLSYVDNYLKQMQPLSLI